MSPGLKIRRLSLRVTLKMRTLISFLTLTSTLILILIFSLVSFSFSQPFCPDCPMGHGRPPYGAYCPQKGWYGAKKPVRSPEEAIAILRSYFQDKELIINIVKERRWGFIAEITRSDGTLVDIVIVDRRTGRIRSIY